MAITAIMTDWIDHNRGVGNSSANKETRNARKGEKRELKNPGEYWEYNDVRYVPYL